MEDEQLNDLIQQFFGVRDLEKVPENFSVPMHINIQLSPPEGKALKSLFLSMQAEQIQIYDRSSRRRRSIHQPGDVVKAMLQRMHAILFPEETNGKQVEQSRPKGRGRQSRASTHFD